MKDIHSYSIADKIAMATKLPELYEIMTTGLCR